MIVSRVDGQPKGIRPCRPNDDDPCQVNAWKSAPLHQIATSTATTSTPFLSRRRSPPPRPALRATPLAATMLASLVGLAIAAPSVTAQMASGRPNVLFDCEGRGCSYEYYRTEMGWMNWVNDQEVSDVHVIMTSTRTGVGGREYRLDFLGREEQATHEDPILCQAEVDDPWNLWVFRINGNANLDGESLRSTQRFRVGVNRSRVTPTWKLSFNGGMNHQRREVELEDDTFRDNRTDWNFDPTVV